MIEYNKNKVFEHSKYDKLEYIGKCLLIKEGKEKLLVVGDLHLGYEETLNQSGIFVSRKMFEEMIGDLERIFEKTGEVDKIVLLGDVKHNFGGILRQEWNDVLRLFDFLKKKCKEIIITKGNHDMILEPIVRKEKKVKLVEYYIWKEYGFLHGNKKFDEIVENKEIKCIIIGHMHPAIEISDGVKNEKYKCFFTGKFGKREMILVPSFFSLIEGTDPRESHLEDVWKVNINNFKVKVVNDLEVLDFGRLKDIN